MSLTQVLQSFELELEPGHLTPGHYSFHQTAVVLPGVGCLCVCSCCQLQPPSVPRQGQLVLLLTCPGICSLSCLIVPLYRSSRIYWIGKSSQMEEGTVAAVCLNQNSLTLFIEVFRVVSTNRFFRYFASVGVLLISRICCLPGGWYCFHLVLMALKNFFHV